MIARRLSTLAAGLMLLTGCSSEWQPAGDGKMILNTRSGELRVAETGETVDAYQKRLAKEAEARAEKEREAQEKATAAREAEQKRLAAEAAQRQQELAAAQSNQVRAKEEEHEAAIEAAYAAAAHDELPRLNERVISLKDDIRALEMEETQLISQRNAVLARSVGLVNRDRMIRSALADVDARLTYLAQPYVYNGWGWYGYYQPYYAPATYEFDNWALRTEYSQLMNQEGEVAANYTALSTEAVSLNSQILLKEAELRNARAELATLASQYASLTEQSTGLPAEAPVLPVQQKVPAYLVPVTMQIVSPVDP
jgi:chromosome segregation ATPase